MKRIHLFEFEDMPWFPQFLRNYENDFLRFLSEKTHLFKPAISLLLKILKHNDINQIIDLGSGSGGPLISLSSYLLGKRPDLQILLTDFFPNVSAFERTKIENPHITYSQTAVDARNVPKDLKGMRTLFLVFHHFKRPEAKRVLQNAIELGQPIAIFEAQERSLASLTAMILSPLSVFLSTPFIPPVRFGRFFFTYLVPVIPLVVLWDGVVSALRTYSIPQMQELVSELSNKESFHWEIGRKKSGPGMILYLIGTPRRS